MDKTIASIILQEFSIELTPTITRPDEQFGDYATNVAMQLAGRLQKNPREVAEIIASKLGQTGDYAEVSVAGPGFLNIRLTNQALVDQLDRQPEKIRQGEKVVIETNNPNPFKAMHVGHGFNSILADTIANLLEASGAETHRVSYHGDVGAHVGKSMWAILRYLDGDISKLDSIEPANRNEFMSRMYAEGATASKEDEQVKAEVMALAAQSFVLDNPFYKQVYEICKDWSFQQIDSLTARIGSQPIEKRYLESQADALGVETIRGHIGDVFIESDGALVFPGEKYGLFDAAFVASSGRGLYPARDLGLMQLKQADYQADKSFIVTGGEQKQYFENVIKAAELSLPSLTGVTQNISTGTLELTTGKMSSRTGDVVALDTLFDLVQQAVVGRGSEADDDLVAGAMRYQFLKVKIGSDIVFNPTESASLQGNTGSYLQYAHARARRILENVSAESVAIQPGMLNTEERTLVRKLGEYTDVIERAYAELLPHQICNYLFELSQVFNRYYEQHKVVGSDQESHRAGLVQAYAATLKNGLTVLGIHAPQQM